jgi:hypothetical protein
MILITFLHKKFNQPVLKISSFQSPIAENVLILCILRALCKNVFPYYKLYDAIHNNVKMVRVPLISPRASIARTTRYRPPGRVIGSVTR